MEKAGSWKYGIVQDKEDAALMGISACLHVENSTVETPHA
jgi:hypothetical protein